MSAKSVKFIGIDYFGHECNFELKIARHRFNNNIVFRVNEKEEGRTHVLVFAKDSNVMDSPSDANVIDDIVQYEFAQDGERHPAITDKEYALDSFLRELGKTLPEIVDIWKNREQK